MSSATPRLMTITTSYTDQQIRASQASFARCAGKVISRPVRCQSVTGVAKCRNVADAHTGLTASIRHRHLTAFKVLAQTRALAKKSPDTSWRVDTCCLCVAVGVGNCPSDRLLDL